MSAFSKEEMMSLPEKFRPLSPWKYFGLTILYSIPLIGFIILAINAIGNENINRRNFARSYFCIIVVVVVLSVIVGLSGALEEIADIITSM